MLDGFSLDQLRTFIAAADEGSFSAAGRRLGRAQSVVSQTLANLEAQTGLTLFDRTARSPVLTVQGSALLAEARTIVDGVDRFKAQAKGLAGGLEPELSVAVDVMFPIEALTCAVIAFKEAFPATPLRLAVEAMGAVLQPVLDGRCAVGIAGPMPLGPPELTRERLLTVEMCFVAAPSHPLGAYDGPIPPSVLRDHTQLILTDRSELSRGQEFGVYSKTGWRLADLGAKHMFLRAALGWGSMPLGVVAQDIADGTLKKIAVEDQPNLLMPMSAVFRTDTPPGPAGRWLIDRLRQGDEISDKLVGTRRARSS